MPFKLSLLFLIILTSSSLIAQQKEVSDSLVSYLALGDSYTIGESVEESKQWPKQLKDTLSAMGIRIDEPKIIAKTGWRTDEMLSAAKKQLNGETFDLVSLLIGVNNEYQGRTHESFKKEFKECLSYSIDRCKEGKKNVFVLSIPDYGYTPFGAKNQEVISKRLDEYNRICQEICQEYGVTFIYITDISREVPHNQSLVAKDDLHPSGKQYARWIERMQSDVLNLIIR